jgi:hypothetical protein
LLLALGCVERFALLGAAVRVMDFARSDAARAFRRRLVGFVWVAPRDRVLVAGFALVRRVGRFDVPCPVIARFRARFNVRLASLNALRAAFN